MLLRLRCAALLCLPLLLPRLAYADPHYGVENLFWVLLVGGGVVLAVIILSIVLIIRSYRQPERRGLYRAQLVILVFNALVGLAVHWSMVHGGRAELLNSMLLNPFWGLVLSLGLWLNGVRWAQQALTHSWCRIWVSVAVVALGILLGLLPSLGFMEWVSHYNAGPYAGRNLPHTLAILLSVGVVLGSWAVVSRQLRAQLPAAVWQPWWQLPLLTAGLSVACTTHDTWPTFVFTSYLLLNLTTLLSISGQTLLLNWGLGVVALRILRPAYYAPDNPALPAA